MDYRQDSAQESTTRALDAAPVAALGTNTKSSPPSGLTNRANRYIAHDVARRIAIHEGRKKSLEFPADYHRVAKCRYCHIDPFVSVKQRPGDKAFYGGLAKCGSVWVCPLCSNKVCEVRRSEIQSIVDWSYGADFQPLMVTFTFSHSVDQSLKDLLLAFREGLKKLRKGKQWDKAMKSIGFQGLVRTLEINIGRNGWHPHTHELWVVHRDIDLGKLRTLIAKKWTRIALELGLCQPDKARHFEIRSVDIRSNVSGSDYLSKSDDVSSWGVDREMTKNTLKVGKTMHPFALLKKAVTDVKARKHFVEYMETTKELKPRQCYITPALRKLAGLKKELTEKEICDTDDDTSWADIIANRDPLAPKKLFRLEHHGWDMVRKNGLRGVLLDMTDLLGLDGASQLLASLGIDFLDPY